MENNEQNRRGVLFLLSKGLDSEDPAGRSKAENDLLGLTGKPGFAVLLLAIVQDASIDIHSRKSAATYFKNYLRKHWDNVDTIKPDEKEAIKKIVPDLMLSSVPALKRLISATLCEISQQEFPDNWPGLLPGLVQKLNTQDFNQINGILKICNLVFKRFRGQVNSDHVLRQLQTVLGQFQEPMLVVFKLTCQQIQAQAANPAALQVLFTSMKMLTGIFYSLNYVDIPEFFEDHMEEYMTGFKQFLSYESKVPEIIEGKDEESPGLLHSVQVTILNNINLYVEKYEEEFKNYLPVFVQDTWNLLVKTPPHVKFDSLVTSALQFLTTISTGVMYSLFQDPAALAQICEKIIAPNLKLRSTDKAEFEDDPLAYVRKDVEGSDSGTRRRSAYALIKGLRRNFEEVITKIFQSYIESLLAEGKWASKDSAVYLVMALAIKKSSHAKGVVELNTMIPVDAFYRSQVLPELQGDKTKAPLLKASCLTFVNTFRRQFTDDDFKTLVPILISYLSVDSFVIRSYASICIERFLSIQVDPRGQFKWGKAHVQPFLEALLQSLFTALEPQKTTENHYVIKAIARVLAVSKDDLRGHGLVQAISSIAEKLTKIYKHPVNAEFGHFLFEALAAIITTMAQDKSNLDKVEQLLLPIFQRILTDHDSDTFSPYAFQIMSLFIELRGSLPAAYGPLLPELVKARFWEENGNHPALVRLIQAYIVNGPNVVAPQLLPILGVFQRLISSKKNDFLGFYLLESIVNHMDPSIFAPQMKEVFNIVFTRIQTSKTVQLVKSFVVFLCTFAGKHGIAYVVDSMHKLQEGIFSMVLKSLWIPNLPGISGTVEKKAAAIGSIKILCEFSGLQSEQGLPIWSELLQAIIKLFGGAEEAAPTPDYQEEQEDLVYNSGFSNLKYAPKSQTDYFASIPDAQVYLISGLQQLASVPQLKQVVHSLPVEYKQAIAQIFAKHNQPVPF